MRLTFSLDKKSFWGVVKIAPFAPVCMYTEEEGGVATGNGQLANGET